MSIWRPCTFCGQPLAATDHDHGCPHVRIIHNHMPGGGHADTPSARAACGYCRRDPPAAIVHLQPDGVYINGKKVSHDIMSDTVTHFATRPEIVEAIQWTGPEDLPLLQIWLAPISPGYRPPTGAYNDTQHTITVPCYDAGRTQQYTTLGKQYTDTKVVPGSWVIKLASGELAVRTDKEMQATYQRVPDVPAAEPVQAATPMTDAERREFVGGLTAHMRDGMGDPVPGDDVDPTGVVPGVPVVDQPPGAGIPYGPGGRVISETEANEIMRVVDQPLGGTPTAGFAADEVLAELHAAQVTRGDDPARVAEATAPGDEIKF